jgi:hypothetical protein
MRRSEKEQEVHLSHSQVEGFTQCPRRYHLHRRLGIPPEFVPSGLLFGSALHESLAIVHQRRLEGKEATLQEACRAFGVRWRRERLPVRCAPGETEKSLREMARRMLSWYLARHGENVHTHPPSPPHARLRRARPSLLDVAGALRALPDLLSSGAVHVNGAACLTQERLPPTHHCDPLGTGLRRGLQTRRGWACMLVCVKGLLLQPDSLRRKNLQGPRGLDIRQAVA